SGLKQFLELEGYKVDVAYNGFRAGKIFQDKNHKLVILDLVMPGLDGFDVCKAIRESESGKQTKIILLTGYLSKANRQKAKKVGVDKYQAKPVDSESLLKEIKKLIR
ncbi:MAG: response regulator, partial [Candidatus Omnitrophica bacterium]|nr:response regulator [Candidatus Omnitrophota bacterium]